MGDQLVFKEEPPATDLPSRNLFGLGPLGDGPGLNTEQRGGFLNAEDLGTAIHDSRFQLPACLAQDGNGWQVLRRSYRRRPADRKTAP